MANKRKRASTLGILASDEDSDGVRRRSSKRKNYVEPDSDDDEFFDNDEATKHNEGNGKTLTNGELADTAAEDSDGEEGAAVEGKHVDRFTISLKIGHDAAQQLERSGSVNGHQHAGHNNNDDDSDHVTTRQRTSRKTVRVSRQTEEEQHPEEEFNEFEDNTEQQVEKEEEEDGEDDEEEEVIRPYPRSLRRSSRRSMETSRKDEGKRERPTRSSRRLRRRASSESEEYQVESEDLEAELSDLTGEKPDIRGFIDDSEDDMVKRRPTRRSRRGRGRPKGSTKVLRRKKTREQDQSSDYEDSGQNEEEDLQEELRDLNDSISPPPDRKHQLRARKEVNYQIPPPLGATDDYSMMAAAMPPSGVGPQPSSSHNKRGGRNANQGPTRRLFPTTGPFGGSDVVSIFGYTTGGAGSGSNNTGAGAAAGGGTASGGNDKVYNGPVDSDSSDDETAGAKIVEAPGVSGKPKKTGLADSDPLGVDMNIDFNSVGGLDTYINQLKEMVSLPLRYPEIYKQFNVTPPRGVLFHGPPGTGKTLMARALAASCSSDGKKITFFMRKGADCLSKWVGEAERQLRLLFEEARNQQPSIIFFDEIDGLAPVRSSKQEQIHASIVSTLLALMDGMDNRGQVIVIGATNRPDSVDPALRRPGRFDREFYFPLPDIDARKKIIGIHTKKWDPPLRSEFIEKIASLTKGYGGADLRALCTEAALNAIQRRYPQIYMSDKKLLVDPQSIHVTAADFMKSVEKIVPSSARSTSSGAEPLPGQIEPLLKHSFDNVKEKLDHLFPKKKKLSALEEAMYEQVDDDGFEKQEAVKGECKHCWTAITSIVLLWEEIILSTN
ncbi:hypothetical protein TRICI_006186 [Trichomonascus ciferrii]|uniref:AAA+ ATPase domain-containing protein n=1 Tax=Trichomonascus ciferrii TaxID=44093 RepID=A0A642UKG4_9ASCO|nr:hypothetical protein TRICI_006186 [Trichomonascus ciferrii]